MLLEIYGPGIMIGPLMIILPQRNRSGMSMAQGRRVGKK